MKVWHNLYDKITTLENIFRGFEEFRVGKSEKRDVMLFERDLEDNLYQLHQKLQNKTYLPGSYVHFYVKDPKIRPIHKATVQDRIVHHIVSRVLEVIFEPTFIAHSYSCRKNKGTHKGVVALQKMARKVSRNNTRTCWALKCDIKKFFASVNHQKLLSILSHTIKDADFLDLLEKIIESFPSGIPIGNLTSQFFSNIYMHTFDMHMKHTLKVRYYLRYADDFVILSEDKEYLEKLITPIELFLKINLDLELHPQKVIYSKFGSGIDFLGYIIFPYHILPRSKTKRRLMKKIRKRIREYKDGDISEEKLNETIQSYLGYLSHASTYKFKKQLQNLIWFWLTE